MEKFDVVVNRLPVLTWNRLRMNQSQVSGVFRMTAIAPVCTGGTLTSAPQDGRFAAIATGCGQALSALMEDSGLVPDYLAPQDGAVVRLQFDFAAEAAQGSLLSLHLRAGESAVVLMDYTAPQTASGQGVVQTRILLEQGARLHLVQVQRVGEGFTFFNDIGADCSEGARFELTQLVLGGQASYTGCQVDLTGNGSSFDAGLAYALSGTRRLDINYLARHIGKRTTSNIHAGGSLRDRSFKLFRGTIDFINGSAGSVGSELEEVLLIDDNCVNQTIPLILCAEEDVEGNHGASIGKPNEETLFYLESRGIPEADAYALLTRAKLDAAAGRIPDEDFRQEIYSCIKGGESDD